MHILMRNVDSPRSEQKWRLHPLIHTFIKFNLVQDIEIIIKARQKIVHHLAERTPLT